jgi:hypothetical protein
MAPKRIKQAKPAWATKGMEWAEDNDDARFVPIRKHHSKSKGGVHKQGMSTVGGKKRVAGSKSKSVANKPHTRKKVTRKRIAGK